MQPAFPLKAILEDGDVWELEDIHHVECSLEDMDTDSDPGVKIYDNNGRRVRLKVDASVIKVFELMEE